MKMLTQHTFVALGAVFLFASCSNHEETGRLQKELSKAQGELEQARVKLSDPNEQRNLSQKRAETMKVGQAF